MDVRIHDNIARVQDRIEVAAERAGRKSEEIRLIAVTKKQSALAVCDAIAAGVTDIGENYIQEGVEKRLQVQISEANAAPVRWHFQGHLQSNKARVAVENFDLIQSVDSVKLGQVIGKHAQALGKTQSILLQVHLGDETTKFGFLPEATAEAAAALLECEGVVVQGLMGIAPFGSDARPFFRSLFRLFEALPPQQRSILSMGMTGDFEIAIEEGATMVRVGTAIFGTR